MSIQSSSLSLYATKYILLNRYEILSDSQKRSVYDARGESGLNDQGGMGMDPQVRLISLTQPFLHTNHITP